MMLSCLHAYVVVDVLGSDEVDGDVKVLGVAVLGVKDELRVDVEVLGVAVLVVKVGVAVLVV